MTPRLAFVASVPDHVSLVVFELSQAYASALTTIAKVGLTLCLDLTYERSPLAVSPSLGGFTTGISRE